MRFYCHNLNAIWCPIQSFQCQVLFEQIHRWFNDVFYYEISIDMLMSIEKFHRLLNRKRNFLIKTIILKIMELCESQSI